LNDVENKKQTTSDTKISKEHEKLPAVHYPLTIPFHSLPRPTQPKGTGQHTAGTRQQGDLRHCERVVLGTRPLSPSVASTRGQREKIQREATVAGPPPSVSVTYVREEEEDGGCVG
jgi:hypothetical protein